MPSYFDLLKYAATGIASPSMTYYDKMRASTLMGGGTVQTLTGIPPLSFKADGTPLISWSMLGNGQQTGTPTPDNPVMPEFVGVRTGNLYFKIIAGTNISDSGTITTLTGFDLCIAKVERGVQYSGNGYIYAFFETEPTIGSISYNDSRAVNNFINVAAPISGFVAVRVPSTAQNVMCNTGSYVLPYEPYGYKIPLTAASVTTPLYLGEVSTVRRIKKLVLDGTENFGNYTNPPRTGVYLYLSDLLSDERDNGYCTHFVPIRQPNQYTVNGITFGASNTMIYLTFSPSTAAALNLTDTNSIKEWLQQQYAAGTPVTVWYVLAEPQTAIVNEPLAKIGDYADELHSTDAGVTIPTAKGQNTLTVDTELQPSEMTITFKG